ncbi:hypothetical protein [Dysosmobacter sp. Sow4_B12]|uniref:hypothetical protein n=1 Tax=Dysosmobacter sp. Sow4_B12 TaxID=3438777 RepID=UPI003F934CD9
MWKYLFALIAVMSTALVITGCSEGNNSSDETVSTEASFQAGLEEEFVQSSIYDDVLSIFFMSDVDMPELNDSTVAYTMDTWNDSEDYKSGLNISIYYIENTNYEFGFVSNEDFSRNRVLWVSVINPDREQFNCMLDKLNYHQEPYRDIATGEIVDIPYGYISVEDTLILINGSNEFMSHISDEAQTADGTAIHSAYELLNVKAIADVLGIDANNTLSQCASFSDVNVVYNNLRLAVLYGVRGYEEYWNTNGFGTIMSDYNELSTALSDPENSDLSEVHYLINEGGSDPTNDPDSPYYEPPIDVNLSSGGSNSFSGFDGRTDYGSSNKRNCPAIVQAYIDSGYDVYKINQRGASGYYYAEYDSTHQFKTYYLIVQANNSTNLHPQQILYSKFGSPEYNMQNCSFDDNW